MARTIKPEPAGTVWPDCLVQIIDESDPNRPVWKTIGTCTFTPRAIQVTMQAKGRTDCWVKEPTGGRRMWFAGRDGFAIEYSEWLTGAEGYERLSDDEDPPTDVKHCECGCGSEVVRRFRQGHDSKLKSAQRKAANA